MLSNLCHLLDNGMFEPYTSAILKAAATLAFFGLLQCGEFTSCSNILDAALSRSDVTFFQQDACLGLAVNFKASKTDPFRAGCLLKICQIKGLACPVNAITQFLKLRSALNLSVNSPLFSQANGRPLSRGDFVEFIRSMLESLGLNSRSIGGATAAAAARIPDRLNKTMGRWSSNCYQTYIQTPLALIREAQIRMAR